MKAMIGLSALLAVIFASATPVLANDGYSQFYVNPNYSVFGGYYPSSSWGYNDHAFHAQQHETNAWQHAQMDVMYASPRHAAAAVRHAIRDTRHAARDAYGLGGWY